MAATLTASPNAPHTPSPLPPTTQPVCLPTAPPALLPTTPPALPPTTPPCPFTPSPPPRVSTSTSGCTRVCPTLRSTPTRSGWPGWVAGAVLTSCWHSVLRRPGLFCHILKGALAPPTCNGSTLLMGLEGHAQGLPYLHRRTTTTHCLLSHAFYTPLGQPVPSPTLAPHPPVTLTHLRPPMLAPSHALLHPLSPLQVNQWKGEARPDAQITAEADKEWIRGILDQVITHHLSRITDPNVHAMHTRMHPCMRLALLL